MAAVASLGMLLPPQPAFDRYGHASAHIDSSQLTERFWKAVKLDSPTSPTFQSSFDGSPIDETILRVVHADDAATTFADDPIVAFETFDCYSPHRPTFPTNLHHDPAMDPEYQPCPYGEPPGLCTSPAPTLGSIRYHDKSPSRHTFPWAAMTLRPTRFRAPTPTSSGRQGPSVLALASAFLDSIVRLARSRTNTPTIFTADGRGPVTILESEVLIDVLDDGKRAAAHDGRLLDDAEHVRGRLVHPPASAITLAHCRSDGASPTTSTDGPKSCSQGSDNVIRDSWEWHVREAKARPCEPH